MADRRRSPKDGTERDTMYSLRMPADLKRWMDNEAARRTIAAGRKTTAADIAIEALRRLRTQTVWRRHQGGQ